jgi:hypothetical protein
MKERPILFSAPMVRAILSDSKTQTRRVMKPQPPAHVNDFCTFHNPKGPGLAHFGFDPVAREALDWFAVCPYGQVGDRLWVREAWAHVGTCDPGLTVYRADYPACVPRQYQNVPPDESIKWKPSIHMFRADSRITLEITEVRVERLQDICEADAIAEGISEFIGGWWCEHDDAEQIAGMTPQEGYRHLWERINGPGSWEANPWVWAVNFKGGAC